MSQIRATEASNYKRMQRFFRLFEVKMEQFAKMVMSIASIPQPWVLSIDRTNGSFGTTHFNILTYGSLIFKKVQKMAI
jgi:hypothetical protein